MGRHASLYSMVNLNMRRQAAREMGEGLSDRDKASGMYRVYNRRKIANGVAAGLGVVGTVAGLASNPAAGVALGVRTGLATARGHYNDYKAVIAASGHTANLENVHAAQLVDMYNKTTGRKQSSVARALDIGAVGIGRFDSRYPAVGAVATVAATAAVGSAVSHAGSMNLNLIPSLSGGHDALPSPGKPHVTEPVKWPDLDSTPSFDDAPSAHTVSSAPSTHTISKVRSNTIYGFGRKPYYQTKYGYKY